MSGRAGAINSNNNNYGNNRNLGFTIVELLIVIVIIGILAAITIVSYTGITTRANQASIQAELTNASKKLAIYYAQNGSYPASPLDGNGCPLNPVPDTQNCIKFGSGTSYTYTPGAGSNPTTYALSATKGTISYNVTQSTGPFLGTAPTLPESDWITIGTQRWARKNLNVGTRIAGTSAQTNNGGTNIVEKYCYGDTDAGCTNTDANGIAYGALYQWDEAMNYSTAEGAQGICPTGSHIPTDAEWKTLEMYLGMTQAQADLSNAWRGTTEGTQLKSGGTSGLNVPLAGYRTTDGSFLNLSTSAYLWSSSESSTSAWYRVLNASYATVYRYTTTKARGFSVRCLGN